MMQNATGQEVDYDAFKSQFDSNPQMKNLVDKFDENGIIIKTKNKAGEPTQLAAKKEKAKNNVAASAKRAAAKMIG